MPGVALAILPASASSELSISLALSLSLTHWLRSLALTLRDVFALSLALSLSVSSLLLSLSHVGISCSLSNSPSYFSLSLSIYILSLFSSVALIQCLLCCYIKRQLYFFSLAVLVSSCASCSLLFITLTYSLAAACGSFVSFFTAHLPEGLQIVISIKV